MKVTLALSKDESADTVAEWLTTTDATDKVMVVPSRIVWKDKTKTKWSDGPSRLHFETNLDLPHLERVVATVAPSADMLLG